MRPTLAVLLLSVQPVLADPRLAGEFQGTIWSGVDAPGTTVLTVEPDGRIHGDYRYNDGAGEAGGRLTDCSYAILMLRCRWHDAFGSGPLVLSFAPDFQSFRGSWYDISLPEPHDRPEGGYLWTGSRPSG